MEGVTDQTLIQRTENEMDTEVSGEMNLTLPNLVRNAETDTTKVTPDIPVLSTPTKTHTEWLLDAFGSPVPSELEDGYQSQTREYHTTEDEDDAIDGLLALSKQSSQHNQKMSTNKSPESSTKPNEKNKPTTDSTSSGKPPKPRNKQRKNNKEHEDTDGVQKQMERMNINE